MAARKTNFDPAYIREKIRTTQLVKRLEDFAFGSVKMEPAQVTAALGVLKKTLPDLAAQTDKDGNTPKTLIEVVQRAPNRTPA
jgi:hypothetical protein